MFIKIKKNFLLKKFTFVNKYNFILCLIKFFLEKIELILWKVTSNVYVQKVGSKIKSNMKA